MPAVKKKAPVKKAADPAPAPKKKGVPALRFRTFVETINGVAEANEVKGQTQVFIHTDDTEAVVADVYIVDGNLHLYTKEAVRDLLS